VVVGTTSPAPGMMVAMPRVNADGVELYYESLGEGVPLILQAHDHRPWLFFQAPYFAQYYRVLTFDRRGTGRSASPPGPWTIADFGRDLRAFMDTLGIERAIVGGSSLGGMIAAQFAVDYPGRASALIIGHTVPYLWDLAIEWVDALMEAARAGRTAIDRQPRSYPWEEIGPPTTNPVFAQSDIARLATSVGTGVGRDVESVLKMHEAVRAWDQRPRFQDLHALRVPALVIVGANEPQKTVELAYEWHQQIPGSEFVILRDTYHAAPRENALDWNRTVHDFLGRNGL
jgi:pimeloyl-ACP methyl ester carboxylesterase